MKDKYLDDNILSIQTIELPDALLLYTPQFFSREKADELFQNLENTLAWAQGEITIFGKKVKEPRLTAWYGDEGKSYKYSGKIQHPLSWTADLAFIKQQIEEKTRDLWLEKTLKFNSVLANYYRDGTDSMGWHSDDEPELGQNPIIASLNFGESRRFLMRHKKDKNIKKEIVLTHGSLLIMAGTMQHHWQHAVPKEPKKMNPRINLTYRFIF